MSRRLPGKNKILGIFFVLFVLLVLFHFAAQTVFFNKQVYGRPIESECYSNADCGPCYRCSDGACVYNCPVQAPPPPPPPPNNTTQTSTPAPTTGPTGGAEQPPAGCPGNCCVCSDNQCLGYCGGPGWIDMFYHAYKSGDSTNEVSNQPDCANYKGSFDVNVTAQCIWALEGLDCGTGQPFTPNCSWSQCGTLQCRLVKDHGYQVTADVSAYQYQYYNDPNWWSAPNTSISNGGTRITYKFGMPDDSNGPVDQSFTLSHQCAPSSARTELFMSNGEDAYTQSTVTERVSPLLLYTQVIDQASGYSLSPTYTNGRIDYSFRLLNTGSYGSIAALQNRDAYAEETWNYGGALDNGEDYQIKADFNPAGGSYYCSAEDVQRVNKRGCTANTNTLKLAAKPPDESCGSQTYSSSALTVPTGTNKICVKFTNDVRTDVEGNIYNRDTEETIKNPAGMGNPYTYNISALPAGTYNLRAHTDAEEPYCKDNGDNTLTISSPPVTPTFTSTPTFTPTFTPTLTFTPTPTNVAACTVDTVSPPPPTCSNTNPTLTATYNNGANRIQYAVDNSNAGGCNPFDANWNCNGGWVSGTYSCNLNSGSYYWSARSDSSTGQCLTSCFDTPKSFSIDKVPPTDPTLDAPSCSDQATSAVRFTFNSADQYCGAVGSASNKASSYHVQAYDNQGNWYINGWFNPQTKTITGSHPGTTACTASSYDAPCLNIDANDTASSLTLTILNVQDSLGNQNPVNVTTTYSLSPACQLGATVSGSFFVDTNADGAKDAGENLVDASSGIQVVPTYSGGGSPATVSCVYLQSTYRCTFSNFASGATYNFSSSNLSPYSYQTGCSGAGGSCSLTLNRGDTKTLDLGFLKGSFLQTSGGSVHAGGGISMEIPQNPLHYVTGAATSRVMVLDKAGVVTTNGTQTYSQLSGAQASTPNYKDTLYTNSASQFNYDFFQSKFANRSQVINTSGTAQLSEGKIDTTILANNTVYDVRGNLNVQDSNSLNNLNVVILVNGNLTINNNFTPINNGSGSYVAFIASGSITIAPTVTEVQAILLSNGQFSDAPSVITTPLKIIGSVHSLTGLTFNRSQTTDKPGEYIVEDPAYFIKLATPLGLSAHNWEEVTP